MRSFRGGKRSISRWLVNASIALLLTPAVAGCGNLGGGGLLGPQAQIDWVNVVQFGGITYLAATQSGRPLVATDLGPQFASVHYRLDVNVHDLSYRLKDGDAAYLDAGAPVYAVRGYAPTFRLAARQNGRLALFEADSNPQARVGADLLDIGGKVRSIGIVSTWDGKTALAAIGEPRQVAALVQMALAAPVDQMRQATGEARYIIAFHLTDGTATQRGYSPGTGELARGIMLPTAFRDAIEQALRT